MLEIVNREAQELLASNKDPLDFAIEAIRLNLIVAAYKNEEILFEALKKLKGLKNEQSR